MHLSLILNADTYYAVHIANIILTDLLYSIIYYFLLPFAAYLITALGTFMSIGLRRPSIREHLLTYLLELLASIQRHGLKALHPTPSPHYLDHWVEPVQIRVSLIMIFASSQVWPLSHRRLLLQVYLILVHFLVLFHYIALISFFILCAVSSQFLSSPSSHYSNVRFFVQKFNFDKTLLLGLFSRQIKLVKKLKKHTHKTSTFLRLWFLVKSKLSTVKKCKPAILKAEFLDKYWRFRTVFNVVVDIFNDFFQSIKYEFFMIFQVECRIVMKSLTSCPITLLQVHLWDLVLIVQIPMLLPYARAFSNPFLPLPPQTFCLMVEWKGD